MDRLSVHFVQLGREEPRPVQAIHVKPKTHLEDGHVLMDKVAAQQYRLVKYVKNGMRKDYSKAKIIAVVPSSSWSVIDVAIRNAKECFNMGATMVFIQLPPSEKGIMDKIVSWLVSSDTEDEAKDWFGDFMNRMDEIPQFDHPLILLPHKACDTIFDNFAVLRSIVVDKLESSTDSRRVERNLISLPIELEKMIEQNPVIDDLFFQMFLDKSKVFFQPQSPSSPDLHLLHIPRCCDVIVRVASQSNFPICIAMLVALKGNGRVNCNRLDDEINRLSKVFIDSMAWDEVASEMLRTNDSLRSLLSPVIMVNVSSAFNLLPLDRIIAKWAFLTDSQVLSEQSSLNMWRDILWKGIRTDFVVFSSLLHRLHELHPRVLSSNLFSIIPSLLEATDTHSFPKIKRMSSLLKMRLEDNEVEVIVRGWIKKLASSCNHSETLSFFWKEGKQDEVFGSIVDDCLQETLKGFPIVELEKWLHFHQSRTNFPNLSWWRARTDLIFRNPQIRVVEKIKLFQACLSRFQENEDAWNRMIWDSLVEMPILDRYVFLAKEVEKCDIFSEFADKEIGGGMISSAELSANKRSEWFWQFVRALSENTCIGERTKTLQTKFINACFSPLLPSDSGTYFDRSFQQLSTRQFFNDCLAFCFDHFKIVEWFATYENLLKALAFFDGGGCLAISVLRGIGEMNRCDWRQPCSDLVERKLAPAYKNLAKEENLEELTWKVVDTFHSQIKSLQKLESVLKFYSSPLSRWIQSAHSRLSEFKSVVSKHALFVNALRVYFSRQIADLEQKLGIDGIVNIKGLSLYSLKQRIAGFVRVIEGFSFESRRLMEHFAGRVDTGIEVKSVLFHHHMTKEIKEAREIVERFDGIVVIVEKVYNALKNLCFWPPEKFTVNQVVSIQDILVPAHRSMEKEWTHLFEYQPFRPKWPFEDIQHHFKSITSFLEFRSNLLEFSHSSHSSSSSGVDESILKRLNFTCALEHDQHYELFVQATSDIQDFDNIRLWTTSECGAKMEMVGSCFGANGSVKNVCGFLSLLQSANKSIKVWEFFHNKPEFVGSNNGGFSNVFYLKIREFLDEMSGEDSRILETFEVAAHWVALLQSATTLPFQELFTVVVKSSRFRHVMDSTFESNPFGQLITAEEHMDFITDLFRYGLSGLDSILGQSQMMQHASFVANLAVPELTASFYDHKRKMEIKLSASELEDFSQRLGFVQREEKAQQFDVASLLERIASYRRLLPLLKELHVSGHPDFLDCYLSLSKSSDPLPFASNICENVDLEYLQGKSKEWDAHIDHVLKENKLLSLFFFGQAQKIAESVEKQKIDELYFSSLHVARKNLTREEFNQFFVGYIDSMTSQTADWSERASSFLLALSNTAGSIFSNVQLNQMSKQASVRYKSAPSNGLIQQLLCKIFESQAPLSCQIFWCEGNASHSTLSTFLNRALSFPHLRFVIVKFEKLEINEQLTVLKLLMDHPDAVQLHIIECEASFLESVSWIPSVVAEDVCRTVDEKEVLNKWIRNGDNRVDLNNLICFHGPTGSGKTFQLRRYAKKLNASLCNLAINETFDWDLCIKKVMDAFVSSNNVVLVIQLNIGKFTVKERERWDTLMTAVNIFLFHLIAMKSIVLPYSPLMFNLPPNACCKVLFELPDRRGHLDGCAVDTEEDLHNELPMLKHLFKFVDASKESFEMNGEARHVAKYLKAYEDGTIDSLYGGDCGGSKDVCFVLDSSGSMGGGRIEACKSSMFTHIFPRLHADDNVGLICFSSQIVADTGMLNWRSGAQQIYDTTHRAQASGGTNMWTAIRKGLSYLRSGASQRRKVLVALTDGESFDDGAEVGLLLRDQTGVDIQVLFITIDLHPNYAQPIRNFCIRDTSRDFMIDAASSSAAIEAAWREIGDRLTVSQKIEKAGENISDVEAHRLLKKYLFCDNDRQKPSWTRQHQAFAVKYMFRRCGILASSEKFNKNKDLPKFGSTTMAIMLDEVKQALNTDFQIDWNNIIHEQMVYRKESIKNKDGEMEDDYSWSILCSNPDSKNKDWCHRLQLLKSLRLHVPTLMDIQRTDRRVLDSYLAYGLGVPLSDVRREKSSSGENFDFPLGSLSAIDKEQFVLTLDFVIKMLTINERIECGLPCVMEGETGVSKTALTKMLFVLKNQRAQTSELRLHFGNTIKTCSDEDAIMLTVLQCLANNLCLSGNSNVKSNWNDRKDLLSAFVKADAKTVMAFIHNELRNNTSLDPLGRFSEDELRNENANVDVTNRLLEWLLQETLKQTQLKLPYWAFFGVNVHASMKYQDFKEIITQASNRAENSLRLGNLLSSPAHLQAKICIFFDEINTSTCMGLLKELLIDRSFGGEPLPSNVVIIAACNPAREKLHFHNNRKAEHGIEWVSGHYQVHPLPKSVDQLKWDFGSLQPGQEKEFIYKRLEFLVKSQKWNVSRDEVVRFAGIIDIAHQLTKEQAYEHMKQLIQSSFPGLDDREVQLRACSAISLRDILRVFKIFVYFMKANKVITDVLVGDSLDPDDVKRKLLLSIAITYYLRLGTDHSNSTQDFRRRFRSKLKEKCGTDVDIEAVVKFALSNLIASTSVESGVAKTRGLNENIFMVFSCIFAHVPLMIIGPPGSSKTLAVTTVLENARGEFSSSEIFKAVPSMTSFHYQCSRKSASSQIEELFDRAILQQKKANENGANIQCVVFMDEAGLPEEGRESLKVLHYYLEDHMKVDAQVSFVAISNHVLDAAKSNRCAILMRAPPNHDELMGISAACLGSNNEASKLQCSVTLMKGNSSSIPVLPSLSMQHSLLDILCDTFEACIAEKAHPRTNAPPPNGFLNFFGLRDYMYFMKQIGRSAFFSGIVTSQMILEALERNFNGGGPELTKQIVSFFMDQFAFSRSRRLQNPLELMFMSLKEQCASAIPLGRYILVIDTTSNDSALRLFMKNMHRNVSKPALLLKLSEFANDFESQQINLISQVRWSMERGDLVILSRTESLNESFFDLFNLHFRKFEDRTSGEPKITYHTNVAIGAHSRRCRVENFQCIVHLTLEELQVAPAPFLNRFEKYVVTLSDALSFKLLNDDHLKGIDAIRKALRYVLIHVQRFVHIVGRLSFFGFAKSQTIESIMLRVLESWTSTSDVVSYVCAKLGEKHAEISDFFRNHSDSLDSSLLSEERESLLEQILLSPANAREVENGAQLLAICMLIDVMESMIDIAIPEQILMSAPLLPDSVVERVLHSRKFSISGHFYGKQIIFTRTTSEILRLRATKSQSDVVFFGDFTRLTEFDDVIKRLLKDRSRVVIFFDLSQHATSHLNFARSRIDEIYSDLCSSDHKTDLTVQIVVHSANIDLRSFHAYDCTVVDDWHYRFVDGLESTSANGLLQYAYLPSTQTLNSFVQENMLSWCDASVNAIVAALDIKFGTKVVRVPKSIVETFLKLCGDDSSTSLQSMICSRFVGLISGGDGSNDSNDAFRMELQRCVANYVYKPTTVSLVDSLNHSMEHIFIMFFAHFFSIVAHDVDFTNVRTAQSCIPGLFAGLPLFPLPPLAALHHSLKPIHLEYPSEASGFPYFSKIFGWLQLKTKAVLEKYSENDSEDVWTIMIDEIEASIVTSFENDSVVDFESKFLREHCWNMPDSEFDLYLNKYLESFFGLMGKESLSFQYVKQWLLGQIVSSTTGKIVHLHLCGHWYRDLILSYALDIQPISQLNMKPEDLNSLLTVAENYESTEEELHEAIVEACYRSMLHVFSTDELLQWLEAVQNVHVFYSKAKSMKKLKTEIKAITLLKHLGTTLQTISSMKKSWEEMISSIDRIVKNAVDILPFSSVWIIFAPLLDFDKKALFLLGLLIDKHALDSADRSWILTKILCSDLGSNPSVYAPVLDALIFEGQSKLVHTASTCGNIVHWVGFIMKNRADVTGNLACRTADARFTPHWLRSSQDNAWSLFCDVFFHVVWKWLIQFHRNDSLVVVLDLITQSERSDNHRTSVAQRIVTSALQVFLVHKWAKVVIANHALFENERTDVMDRFMDQIELLNPSESWRKELLRNLGTTPQAQIDAWLEKYAPDNHVLRGWLSNITDLVPFDNKWKLLLPDSCDESQFIAPHDPVFFQHSSQPLPVFFSSRGLIRSLWILPTLWDFYQWLSSEVAQYSISEQKLKMLTIGLALRNSAEKEGKTRINQWRKIISGVNQCSSIRHSVKATLDDEMSLWELLSVTNSLRVHDGKLFEILQEIISCLGKDFPSASVSSLIGKNMIGHGASYAGLSSLSGMEENELDSLLENDSGIVSLSDVISNQTLVLEHTSMPQRLRWIQLGLSVPDSSTILARNSDSAKLIATLGSFLCALRSKPIKPIFCTVSSASRASNLVQSDLMHIFHSLEYQEIKTLIEVLTLIHASDVQERSVKDALKALYDADDLEEYSIYLGVNEPEQMLFLLQHPVQDLPAIISFLQSQLDSEAYIFANKPQSLKKTCPENIDRIVQEVIDRSDSIGRSQISELHNYLIKHEASISSKTEESLNGLLVKTFQSEEALFHHLPILRDLTMALREAEYDLKCGHYVYLRLKLRNADQSSSETTRKKSWEWDMFGHTEQNSANIGVQTRKYAVPWFLEDFNPVVDIRNEEINQFHKRSRSARVLQKWWVKVGKPWCLKKRSLLLSQDSLARESNVHEGGRGRGRGRGRGGGGRGGINGRGMVKATGSISSFIEKSISDLESIEIDVESVRNLLQQITCTEAYAMELKRAIAKVASNDLCARKEAELLKNASTHVTEVENRLDTTKKELLTVMGGVPLNVEDLRSVLQTCILYDLHESSNYLDAERLLGRADQLFQRATHAKNLRSLSKLQLLRTDMKEINLAFPHELQEMIIDIEKEAADLESLLRCANFFEDEEILRFVLDQLLAEPDSFDFFDSTTVQQRELLVAATTELDCQSTSQKTTKCVDGLIKKLKSPSLKKWDHSLALLALAYSSPTHFKLYESHARSYLNEYLEFVRSSNDNVRLHKAVWLVFARLAMKSDDQVAARMLRRCDTDMRPWMSAAENSTVDKMAGSDAKKTNSEASDIEIGEAQKLKTEWAQVQSVPGAKKCDSISTLLDMIGLIRLKKEVIEIYHSIVAEMALPPKARITQTYHFALLGNPGTGKTTVGKLLGQILKELGIRTTDTVVETSGAKLLRMGKDKVADEINRSMDGVLFIDEAYALEPAKSSEGAAIAMQLLEAAENSRDRLTIIVAGYKDDIETKLFDFNDGFHRRFPFKLLFENYNDQELALIFEQLSTNHKWKASKDVVTLAARKLGRRRNHKNFGNAGAVRELFEQCYRRAVRRPDHNLTMTVEDILGPPPNPSTLPALKAALDELDGIMGLDSVKEKIQEIVNLAAENYNLELRGETPVEVPLNRVFLGNPGTGKTTIAKLYGRILKELGLLSDGQAELKQPKDLLGSVVGETQKKTSALLDRCKGKVLIIDEAYGLHGNHYGNEAVDTMVGMIHNAPGEDIAVILIGYDKPMRKMFREMNSGLTRRFALDDPFVFEDFSDDILERIALQELSKNGYSMSMKLLETFIRSVSNKKFAPNFGNAGTLITAVKSAMQRALSRDPSSRTLKDVDFGLQASQQDPFDCLKHLYKTEHVQKELNILKALVKQCEQDNTDPQKYLKNYVFLGNPGTGKTTVARIFAEILVCCGLLSRNHIVFRSGLDLQGDFVGQTKTNVNKAMEEAQGGVLFIDEAYTLGGKNATIFAKEAVDQLVALMTTPEHLNRTVVILAGYPDAMQTMLNTSNDGLVSRCTGRMYFPDWDAEDCIAFLKQQLTAQGHQLEESAETALRVGLHRVSKLPKWANARDCEFIRKSLYESRALRGSTNNIYTIEDVQYALNAIVEGRVNVAPTAGQSTHPNGEQGHVPPMILAPASTMPLTMPPMPPMPPSFSFEKACEEQTKVEVDDGSNGNADEDPVLVALFVACKKAGYDQDLPKRKELVSILLSVQKGADFPEDIMRNVDLPSTQTNASKVQGQLRRQVTRVLESVLHIVQEEEELLRKLKEAKDLEERLRAEQEIKRQQATQEKLRMCGPCPMGYAWIRCGNGYRCAGGSHFVSDSELPML